MNMTEQEPEKLCQSGLSVLFFGKDVFISLLLFLSLSFYLCLSLSLFLVLSLFLSLVLASTVAHIKKWGAIPEACLENTGGLAKERRL